jgi:hypothetical protein
MIAVRERVEVLVVTYVRCEAVAVAFRFLFNVLLMSIYNGGQKSSHETCNQQLLLAILKVI